MSLITVFSIAVPILGIAILIAYIEKEIPKLIKRKRKEWELEKTKENYHNNVKNIETQRAINKEKLETALNLFLMD